MLLKEFIYFDDRRPDPQEDNRYLSHNDTSVLKNLDTRKTRLTLRMLNDARKASEAHEKEKQEELGLVRTMYANPPAEQASA